MKLKQAILETMGRDALRDALARLDLAEGVDKRVPGDMRARLRRARRATPEALLALLKVGDLRSVCTLQGVDASGRKQQLTERLLSSDAKPPRPPAGARQAGGRKAAAAQAERDAAERPAKNRQATAKPSSSGDTGTATGFETELWAAANALRGNMDAAEYKHVVLGLIFLKYISDAFLERYQQLEAERDEGADPEDPDEYIGANVF